VVGHCCVLTEYHHRHVIKDTVGGK
jgi:hypothetical protein